MENNFFAEKNTICKEQYGYTIVEILLVTLIIGLTLSVSFPLFGAVLNKVKQKEGTLIVNSILKTVKANYALESFGDKNYDDSQYWRSQGTSYRNKTHTQTYFIMHHPSPYRLISDLVVAFY